MFGIDQTIAKIIGGVLLILGLIGFGYYQGYSHEKEKFDQFQAEVKAAAEEQAKEAAKIDARNKKLFEDTRNAYNASLTGLRAYYSMRLNKSGGTLSGTAITTPGAAAKTEYDLPALPPIATLAAQCAETTLMLTSLQDWVKLID